MCGLSARVQRVDQLFEHIKVRGFKPRTQTETHLLGETPHLGNQPAQDVACQDHRRRLRQPPLWIAIARVSRWEFKNSLSWKRDVWERHGWRDFLVKGEGRKRKRKEWKGKQSGGPRDAKTEAAVRVAGRVVVAVRGAHVPRAVIPILHPLPHDTSGNQNFHATPAARNVNRTVTRMK